MSASPARCAVLVPAHYSIEHKCEQGLRALESRGYSVYRAFGCPTLDFIRSYMTSVALAKGFDELFWIDSDVEFHPDDVDRLRGHNLPVCAGLYAVKGQRRFVAELWPGTGEVTFGAGGGLLSVRRVGMGFVHTRAEVYHRMREACELPGCSVPNYPDPFVPYFMPDIIASERGHRYLPEDLAFCERLTYCGYAIVADTTIRLGHIGSRAWTWEDFLRPDRYDSLKFKVSSDP